MKPNEIKEIAHKDLQFTDTEWKVLTDTMEGEMMTRFNTNLITDKWADFESGHHFGTTIKFEDPKPKIEFAKLRYKPNKDRIIKHLESVLLKEGWKIYYNFGFDRNVFKDELQECTFHFNFKTDKPSWLTKLLRHIK